MKRLLKRPEVESITGLSRTTIYSKLQQGTFPPPVRLGANGVAWREPDIQRWIDELPPARQVRTDPTDSRARAAAA